MVHKFEEILIVHREVLQEWVMDLSRFNQLCSIPSL
ncbi:hypothetical protein PMI35_03739 [Pseudomonas sp. GM78]|nr:hypothetical protein PMI35_03739 [Pseudomonas sp. GM78]